jgi:hypothetical protein
MVAIITIIVDAVQISITVFIAVIMAAAKSGVSDIVFIIALAVNHYLGIFAQVGIQGEDRIKAGIPFVWLTFDMYQQKFVKTFFAKRCSEFQMMHAVLVVQVPGDFIVKSREFDALRLNFASVRPRNINGV